MSHQLNPTIAVIGIDIGKTALEITDAVWNRVVIPI
jgi:hypothetical protein